MTGDQVVQIANAVHDKLMNGPVKELRLQESVKELQESVRINGEGIASMAVKVDDMHRWQRDMNHNIGAIRDHLGI